MSTPKTHSWRFILSSLALALLLPATGAFAQDEEPTEPQDFVVAGVTATILIPVEPITDDASVFTVDGDWAPWSIEYLAYQFGVEGEIADATVPTGAQVILDGDLSVTVMADGSADFTDALYDHTEDAITPVDDADLWDAADQLLLDLAADDVSQYTLDDYEIADEACTGEDCDPDTDIGRQQVIYAMNLDGLKCFGRGGLVSVRYAGDTTPVGFTHSLRGVTPSSRTLVVKPIGAVKGWMLRIANDLKWHELDSDLGTPDTIQVVGVNLGYHMPSPGAEVTEMKPVYQIRALVGGVDGDGEEYDDVVVEWYEPADKD